MISWITSRIVECYSHYSLTINCSVDSELGSAQVELSSVSLLLSFSLLPFPFPLVLSSFFSLVLISFSLQLSHYFLFSLSRSLIIPCSLLFSHYSLLSLYSFPPSPNPPISLSPGASQCPYRTSLPYIGARSSCEFDWRVRIHFFSITERPLVHTVRGLFKHTCLCIL